MINGVVFFIIFLYCQLTMCESQVPPMRKIIDDEMSIDTPLTRETHEKFWQELSALGSKQKINKRLVALKAMSTIELNYQKEMWLSALRSYQDQEYRMTYKLRIIIDNYALQLINIIYYGKQIVNYEKVVDELNEEIGELGATIAQKSRGTYYLLTTSAKRKPMIISDKDIFYITSDEEVFDIDITDEFLLEAYQNTKFKAHKIRQLLNPTWIDS